MKHFKDSNGDVLAFEDDGSQDHLIPEDAVALTSEEFNDLVNPPPTDGEKVAVYRAAVGRHIDKQAQAFGFDSIVTAVTYADEPADPLNQSYGQALRAWRSKCWEKCREVLATWQGGGAEPTVEDLIASLPAFVAP